jgi:hypothetical protein
MTMTTKEPVRVQLEYDLTAQVSWAFNQPKPFWVFGYIVDDCESECYQVCLFGGDEPTETIWRGIIRYQLPMPASDTDKAGFNAFLEANGLSYAYPVDDDDDEPIGDDGYPLDMDDETKAWLSTNR